MPPLIDLILNLKWDDACRGQRCRRGFALKAFLPVQNHRYSSTLNLKFCDEMRWLFLVLKFPFQAPWTWNPDTRCDNYFGFEVPDVLWSKWTRQIAFWTIKGLFGLLSLHDISTIAFLNITRAVSLILFYVAISSLLVQTCFSMWALTLLDLPFCEHKK